MAIDPAQLQPQQGMPPTAAGPAMASLPPGAMPAMDPAMMAQMQAAQQPQPPQEKPHTLIPTEISRLLAEAMNEAKMEAAKSLVEWVGDPRGTVTVRDADLLRVWRKRNPAIDPLYEKLVNNLSDEEIMYAMYPARRALIRYGRRTYGEQVAFAEKMAKLDQDPRFDFLDKEIEDEEGDDGYEPPKAEFPSKDVMMDSAGEEDS